MQVLLSRRDERLAHAPSACHLTNHDFSAVHQLFLEFPQSVWNGSLLLHLGTEYHVIGSTYSKALGVVGYSAVLVAGVTDVEAGLGGPWQAKSEI